MSGFEVAGIVLGAFPLAIAALEKYQEVAERLNLFYAIRSEYKRCHDELGFHQLMFKTNLKRLVLPLAVDDDKIEKLLADPGGAGWKETSIDDHLKKRMKDSYVLYFQYVKEMGAIMDNLKQELALDCQNVQDKVTTAPARGSGIKRLQAMIRKDGREFQAYKLKFCNGESARKRLFSRFEAYNDKLKILLESSDEDSRLLQQREAAASTTIDPEVCNVWKQAAKLFRAVTSALNCHCQATHTANLMLQHRTSREKEFHIAFTTYDSSNWSIFKTKILERDEATAAQRRETIQVLEAVPTPQPNHRGSTARNLGIKSRAPTTCTTTIQMTPSLTLTCAQPTTQFKITQEISILCTALNQVEQSCCGYLQGDQCRFYVYTLSQQNTTISPISVTLGQILQGGILPRPTRTQRYNLALILASSFLQLLDSEWFPSSPRKTDIIFETYPNDSSVVKLDQPLLHRQFGDPSEGSASDGRSYEYTNSLDQLGIMLVELCFGQTLEDQSYRKVWGEGRNARETTAFDVLAARDWMREILQEAGNDYAGATQWCLGGNRSVDPTRWRQEMLRNVIQPLQRSLHYLSQGGLGST
ncbi:hypothetical protein FDECE_8333 [Fusarium decemcellulare]|nr:hypothetical protein FDECE_8333 [Fusarium decemcellulare]